MHFVWDYADPESYGNAAFDEVVLNVGTNPSAKRAPRRICKQLAILLGKYRRLDVIPKDTTAFDPKGVTEERVAVASFLTDRCRIVRYQGTFATLSLSPSLNSPLLRNEGLDQAAITERFRKGKIAWLAMPSGAQKAFGWTQASGLDEESWLHLAPRILYYILLPTGRRRRSYGNQIVHEFFFDFRDMHPNNLHFRSVEAELKYQWLLRRLFARRAFTMIERIEREGHDLKALITQAHEHPEWKPTPWTSDGPQSSFTDLFVGIHANASIPTSIQLYQCRQADWIEARGESHPRNLLTPILASDAHSIPEHEVTLGIMSNPSPEAQEQVFSQPPPTIQAPVLPVGSFGRTFPRSDTVQSSSSFAEPFLAATEGSFTSAEGGEKEDGNLKVGTSNQAIILRPCLQAQSQACNGLRGRAGLNVLLSFGTESSNGGIVPPVSVLVTASDWASTERACYSMSRGAECNLPLGSTASQVSLLLA